MARYAVAAAGAMIGFMVAGPAGLAFGWGLGSMVGTLLFPPKMPEGPRLDDLRVQISAYGSAVPKAWGWVRLSGNMFWATDLVEKKKKQRSGGKGGPSQISYHYYANFSVAFCGGPFEPIEIRADGKLIWSADHLTGDVRSKYADHISWQRGTEDDLPPALHERYDGAGNVPGYRGVFKLHFDMLPLEDFANHIPSISVVGFAGVLDPGFEQPFDTLIRDADKFLIAYDWEGKRAYSLTVPYPEDGSCRIVKLGWQELHENRREMQVFSLSGLPYPVVEGRLGLLPAANRLLLESYSRGSPGPVQFLAVDADSGAVAAMGSTVQRHRLATWGAWLVVKTQDEEYCIDGWYYGGLYYLYVLDANASITASWTVANYVVDFLIPGKLEGDGRVVYVVGYNRRADGTVDNDNVLIHKIRISNDGAYSGAMQLLQTVTRANINEVPLPVYCQTDDSLVVLLGSVLQIPNFRVIKVDGSSGAIKFTRNHPGSIRPQLAYADWRTNSVKETYGLLKAGENGGNPLFVNVVDGSLEICEETVSSLVYGAFWDEENRRFLATKQYHNDDGDYVPYQHLFVYGCHSQKNPTGGVYLRDVVADVCAGCGLTRGTDFDVDGLGEQVIHGYLVGRTATARQMLEPLQQAFFFDGIETEGLLRFRYRQNATEIEVDADDLGTVNAGDERVPLLTDVRTQEIELPQKLTLSYNDPAFDYQQTTQYAMRHRKTQWSDHESAVEVPISATADNAKQIVEKMLYQAWMARTNYELQLPRKYLEFDPGDVFIVTAAGVRAHVYVTEMSIGADDLLKFKGFSFASAVFVDSANLGTAPPSPVSQIPLISDSVVVPIDGPLIYDQMDTDGFALAVEGADQTDAYPGGMLYTSVDGSNFTELVRLPLEAVIGMAETLLAPHTHLLIDRTSRLRVDIGARGELSSLTWEAFLNGGNFFLLGNELCSFQIATQVDVGVYDLSVFKRGLQGSEWAAGSHSVGERFVMLSFETIIGVPLSSSQIGLERVYRPVTFGQSLDAAEASEFRFTARNTHMKPLAPAHLRGRRGETGDLTVTWAPRVRINPELKDGVETEVDEPVERYQVRFWDGSTPVRTKVVETPTCSYPAAEQTEDFGAPQSAINCTVAQYSKRVGFGYSAQQTL
ncbi:phage tail protein [Sinorhizobium fredii]|uniref:phage tail protein n=1 Tax=Rhizobium fredii TaxID=380 RepID=UPI0012956BA3|nr:phage tail protein [Sinorhizobium fredii]MQW94058.1 hypothetical protein [Sinorhizobium fredii]